MGEDKMNSRLTPEEIGDSSLTPSEIRRRILLSEASGPNADKFKKEFPLLHAALNDDREAELSALAKPQYVLFPNPPDPQDLHSNNKTRYKYMGEINKLIGTNGVGDSDILRMIETPEGQPLDWKIINRPMTLTEGGHADKNRRELVVPKGDAGVLLHEGAHEADLRDPDRPNFIPKTSETDFRGHHAGADMVERSIIWNIAHGFPAYSNRHSGYLESGGPTIDNARRALMMQKLSSGL
jgi:hypothetical protein